MAYVKTDKVDAGTLASLRAAGYLPEIWTPDVATERKRRLVARRYQVVRHRTRLKNEVHAILHAHLIPKCPRADLFNGPRPGYGWCANRCPMTNAAPSSDTYVNSTRLAEDLDILDQEIAQSALDDPMIYRSSG